MSTATTNMGLTKPASTDSADITVVNTNMDKLDGHSHHGGSDGLAVKNVQSGSISARPSGATDGQLYVANDAATPGLHFYAAGSWRQVSTTAPAANSAALRNLLVNGGFEIWQRGPGPFTVNSAFGPDRWQAAVSGGAFTVNKETTRVDVGSGASMKVYCSYGTGGWFFFDQKVEDGPSLRGRTISASMRVYAGAAGWATRFLDQSGYLPNQAVVSSSAPNTWQTITVTATVPSGSNFIVLRTESPTGDTAYFDNAMLVIGSLPVDYVPLHPADEWQRCQRYYETTGGVAFSVWAQGYAAGAGQNVGHVIYLGARKAIPPTSTVAGAWALVNCGQPIVWNGNEQTIALRAVANGAGTVEYRTVDSTTCVTHEANP